LSRASTDPITAHVELLRAVDRLLAEAQAVRDKRAALDRLLSDRAGAPAPAAERQGVRHGD
jgi:hypothetical protein